MDPVAALGIVGSKVRCGARLCESYCTEVETIEHARVSFHEWQALAAAPLEDRGQGAVRYIQLQPLPGGSA